MKSITRQSLSKLAIRAVFRAVDQNPAEWQTNERHMSTQALRLVFTSDGSRSRSRSRREPYALVKTARHKQKKKETFPFSSASASVASENQHLLSYMYLLFLGISNVCHSTFVWPTFMKLGCITNFDMLFLVMFV